MQSFKNKIVFISGASSGIGKACAIEFAKLDARLVLCARRIDRLEKLSQEIKKKYKIDILLLDLDVRDKTEVENQINNLPEEWKDIDILVNNAGLSRGLDFLHEGSIQDWEEMIDTNVKGLLYVSRNVIPGMVERNQGDIINIGSIAGHEVYQKGNVYCATKHAVDAITKGLRHDLLGTQLRVCTIDPGLVETEFSEVRFRGNNDRAKKVYEGYKPLSPADIADCVVYAASRPKHVQIAEIIVLATAQRSATIVHKDIA
jgi:3-hydroxy acid dehydrogenase / malonic semialdehyde reductase